MVGKIVIAFTLVPLLGYTGVIVVRVDSMVIMVIPSFGEDIHNAGALGSSRFQ